MFFLPQHKYISIADVQIKNEEDLEKCPMSLVSQGGPAQEEGWRKSVYTAFTEHACLLLGFYYVYQARQGPYFLFFVF